MTRLKILYVTFFISGTSIILTTSCLMDRSHTKAREPVKSEQKDQDAKTQNDKDKKETKAERGEKSAKVKAHIRAQKTARRAPRRGTFLVKTAVLNVRARPSLKAPVVGKLTRGTTLPAVSRGGHWVRIGPKRFVHANYVVQVKPQFGEDQNVAMQK